MFTKGFDKYVCVGDTIQCEKNGFDVVARIEHDQDYRIDDDDSHNVDQSVTGCDDNQQEKLLAARKAWFADEWFYCGIVLEVSRAGVVLDRYAASLWGIDANYPGGDNGYLLEVANDLLDEAVPAGEVVIEKLLMSKIA